jgi:hypothetical protein
MNLIGLSEKIPPVKGGDPLGGVHHWPTIFISLQPSVNEIRGEGGQSG